MSGIIADIADIAAVGIAGIADIIDPIDPIDPSSARTRRRSERCFFRRRFALYRVVDAGRSPPTRTREIGRAHV